MAKKKNKKMTLNEFRAWLDGVEELQPDNWGPDAKQWKLIRDKIDSIIESQPMMEAPVRTFHEQPAPAAPTHMVDTPRPTGPRVVPGGSALDAVVDVTPEAQAALSGKIPTGGSNAPPALTLSPDGKIKTPAIDTSDGEYNSAFE